MEVFIFRLIIKLHVYLDTSGKQDNELEFVFYHLEFKNSTLQDELYSIRTDFKIEPRETNNIDQAVKELIVTDNDCLIKIKEILLINSTEHRISLCQYSAESPRTSDTIFPK